MAETLQETLAQMNKEASALPKDFSELKQQQSELKNNPPEATPAQASAPATPSVTPPKEEPKTSDSTGAPATPAVPPTGEPPKETPKAEAPKDNTVPAASNGSAPAQPTDQTVDVPDNAFYGRLSKLTDGYIKSETDFVGLINNYNDLLEKAEKGFEPQFKDERAKLVYRILAENPGKEPEAAMRTLRALNFKPDGKSAKEKLFEGYLLDPRNSDLTPETAQTYFEAEYTKKYSDLEENPITQREQALAVREAESAIQKIQNDFKTAEAPTEQQQANSAVSQEIVSAITNAVDDFGGVRLAFSDNPQENDFMSMAVDDPKEIESLLSDAKNPQEWWNKFASQFASEKGFDYKSFVREFWEMQNHQKKAQLAYNHGFKLGQLAKINESRNSSDPKTIDQTTPAATPKTLGLLETWEGAAKKG